MTWIIGILAAGFILYRGADGSQLFLNAHSIEIVLGGSLVVILMLTPWATLVQLGTLVKFALREDQEHTIEEISAYLKNPKTEISDTHGLIALARDLTEMGCDHAELQRALVDRAETILSKNQGAISVLRNLGKYPPALGMLGTVFGMIRLFAGLSASGAKDQIGPQLAIAMTATLYGLILSNLLLIPLADRLGTLENKRRASLEQTIKLLMSVHEGKPYSVAERIILAAA